MSAEKKKVGRPPPRPGMRRIGVPLRLPQWLVAWLAEQQGTPAELIEAALMARHTLRPSRGTGLEKKLRLYVWEGFSPDYTAGMAFAIAANETDARNLIEKRRGYEVADWGTLQVFPITKRIAMCVSGGG